MTVEPIELPRLIQQVRYGYVNDHGQLDVEFFHNAVVGKNNARRNAAVDSIRAFETDFDEIQARQAVYKAMFRNPRLAKQIAGLPVSQKAFASDYVEVAQYVREGTDFYDGVRKCARAIDRMKDNDSERLKEARKNLDDVLELEEEEKELVGKMGDEISNFHRFVGRVCFALKADGVSRQYHSEGYGFMVYPVKREDERFLEQTPSVIEKDIRGYLDENIEKLKAKGILRKYNIVRLIVDYMYSANGLCVSVSIDREHDTNVGNLGPKMGEMNEFIQEYFSGPHWCESKKKGWFGRWREKRRREKIDRKERRRRKEFERRAYANARNIEYAEHDVAIADLSGKIPSPMSSKEFPNDALDVVINRHQEELARFRNAREEFAKFIWTFKDMKKVMDYFANRFAKRGGKYSFPELKPADERKLEIELLYPIRLVEDRKKDEVIVPNDVKSNGKPVVVTGPNNGGKSVYINSINDAILLAQAGLPVPAQKAVMSVKDALFLHFLKQGDFRRRESTFKSSMERFKQLFLDLPNYNSPHITADELAAGTDHQSAYDVSVRLTKALAGISQRATSYVVTQFKEVAEMAARDFNADAVMFDDSHHLGPGIGDARGLELAESVGLTEEFIEDIVAKVKGGE